MLTTRATCNHKASEKQFLQPPTAQGYCMYLLKAEYVAHHSFYIEQKNIVVAPNLLHLYTAPEVRSDLCKSIVYPFHRKDI